MNHNLYNDTKTGKKSRLYSCWEGMKDRCKPNNRRAKDYYLKGISVCDDWINDYTAFYNWSVNNGYSDKLTLDRKNNDLGYNPDNCRWATQKQQGNNRSTNVLITFQGTTLNIMEWSERLNLKYDMIKNRLKRGWSVSDALTLPKHRLGQKRPGKQKNKYS